MREAWAACKGGLKFAALMSATLFAGSAGAQAFDLQPTLNARLTHTDNVGVAGGSRKSDWITEVSPGISVARDSGRATGRLTASFRNIAYASETRRNNSHIALQGHGEFEAVEDMLFVEADAATRRSNLSPFSGRSSDDFLSTERSNETRSFSVAPRLQFGLGSFADATIRYRKASLDGRGALGGQEFDQWNAGLTSARAFGPLGWGVAYSRSVTTYNDDGLDDITQESVRFTLSYAVTPQFRLRGNVGREDSNFGASRRINDRIVGAGFDWFPTPRTNVSGTFEDRFFGNGYDLSISHRFARSTFQLSAGRNISSSVQRFGSVFQDPFFFALFNDPVLIALLPDPLEREDFLRQFLGLTGDSFVSNAYFLNRHLRASYTIVGARNSLSFAVARSDRSRLSTVEGLRGEDLFRDSDNVDSRSASLTYSHQLSGRSSLNATVARSIAERSGVVTQKTRRLTSSLGYSTNLGPRTVAGLSYRHQRSDGSSAGSGFTENVLTANFGVRF